MIIIISEYSDSGGARRSGAGRRGAGLLWNWKYPGHWLVCPLQLAPDTRHNICILFVNQETETQTGDTGDLSGAACTMATATGHRSQLHFSNLIFVRTCLPFRFCLGSSLDGSKLFADNFVIDII